MFTGNQIRHFYGIEYPPGKIDSNMENVLKVKLAAFLTIDSRSEWLKCDPENRCEIAAREVRKLITYQHVDTMTYSFR